jgi:hypothetical protein
LKVVGWFIRKYRLVIPEAYRSVSGNRWQVQVVANFQERDTERRRNYLHIRSVMDLLHVMRLAHICGSVTTPYISMEHESENHICPPPFSVRLEKRCG